MNCAALPAELLESELFGHEKGAFTGAATTRIGKFEQADTGTIFLDEIGEMKAALQAKLLHVLQDAQFTKLGSNKAVNVDVRVVAATNRDLEDDDAARRVPRRPLLPPEGDRGHRAAAARAARRNHAPRRASSWIATRAATTGRRASSPTSCTQLFQTYDWPGNIRELENMIKRIVILQDEQLVIREMTRSGRAMSTPAYAGAPVAARPHRCARPRPPSPPSTSRRIRADGDDEEPPAEEAVVAAPPGRVWPTSRRPRRESRARDHRRHAAAGALEPPPRGRAARRQLQDAAQQDQGVWHQPEVVR